MYPGAAPAAALRASLAPCAQGSLAPQRTAAAMAEQISERGAGRAEPTEVERTEWETVEHGELAELHLNDIVVLFGEQSGRYDALLKSARRTAGSKESS